MPITISTRTNALGATVYQPQEPDAIMFAYPRPTSKAAAKLEKKPRKPRAPKVAPVRLVPVLTPIAVAQQPQPSPAIVSAVGAVTGKGFQPSSYQQAIFDFVLYGVGDGFVDAVAGSGKTETLVQTAKLLTMPAVFFAFNKPIAEELARRLAGTEMVAKTFHSYGMAICAARFGRVQVDGSKYRKPIKEAAFDIAGYDAKARQTAQELLTKLVNFCRLSLVDVKDAAALEALMLHHDIFCPDPIIEESCIKKVSDILAFGIAQAERAGIIDFTDMIWLPNVLDLPAPQSAWVFVDEAQDTNRAELELVLKCRAPGGRMLFIGDERQAIYGFAGADANSFRTIQQRTNAKRLPLSINYRCPSSHLALARTIVPQIEARPNAPEGVLADVSEQDAIKMLREGDMILCRLTAPLVELCIRLIQQRIPARVRGRDIGKMLTDIVRSTQMLTGYSWEQFNEYLDYYEHEQVRKLQQRDGSESQIESLQDRVNAVRVCYTTWQAASADALCRDIEALFDDGKPYILLSTIHRAKGLENERVFIIRPERMPLTWPNQQDWEAEQEQNLRYVAFTRATQELYFVRG